MSNEFLSMSGCRSSHWPWNALAPPMPIGPTRSGPLPEPIWTARASRAPVYGYAWKLRWIPGFAALNASATCSSTVTCSGASPVPRQQNQTMLTSPGFPVEPAAIALGAADASLLATAEASLLGAADASALGAVLVVDEPQAPKTSAAAAM